MANVPEVAPELLPCPFCGAESGIGNVKYSDRMVREQKWQQGTFFFAHCMLCGASNVGLVGHETPKAAAERWNRRIEAPSPEREMA